MYDLPIRASSSEVIPAVSDQSLFDYPEPPPELRGQHKLRMIGYFGAGAILASVTIGSGETLFASRSGGVFGYSLLWCFVIGSITKGVQVYTAARHITLTGEHPLTHWGLLPGPRNWAPMIIGALSILCFPFFLGALPLVLGELVNEATGVATAGDEEFAFWARTWATIATLIAILLTALQGYGLLERVQTAIVGLLLVSLMAACIAAQPAWLDVVQGALIPRIPEYDAWLLEKYSEQFSGRTPWVETIVYLGVIGGGTYDYLGYIGCLREKRWGAIGSFTAQVTGSARQGFVANISTSPENLRRARQWLAAPAIDVGVSFACVLVFSICFVVLGAAVLRPQQLIPAKEGELLTHQARFLTEMHPSLLYLYRAGVFMAFWGTIYGAYELYARTAYECLAPLSERVREMPEGRFRLLALAYCGVGGLTLLWAINNPIGLISLPALLGGVFTCGLWCFAMLWADVKILPPPLRMGAVLRSLTYFSGSLMTILGAKGLWDFARPLWE